MKQSTLYKHNTHDDTDDAFHRKSIKSVGGFAGVVAHRINYPPEHPGEAGN